SPRLPSNSSRSVLQQRTLACESCRSRAPAGLFLLSASRRSFVKAFVAVRLASLTILSRYGWPPRLLGDRRLRATLAPPDIVGRALFVAPAAKAVRGQGKLRVTVNRPRPARTQQSFQPGQPLGRAGS